MPKRYFAAFGQSNGVGNDNRGHMMLDGTESYSGSGTLVQVWNNDSFNDYADTDTGSGLGAAFVNPTKGADPFTANASTGAIITAGNNSAPPHFWNYLARNLRDYARGFNFCRGSTTIDKWISTAGVRQALYTKSAAILSAARTAEGTNFVLTAVTIHFGEGDNGSGQVEFFKARLLALRTALIADGYADADTLFIVTQPKSTYTASIAVMDELADENSSFVVARTNQFQIDGSDHYYGDALQYVGLACYRALVEHAARPVSLGLARAPRMDRYDVMLIDTDPGLLSPNAKANAPMLLPQSYSMAARGFVALASIANNTWTKVPLSGDLGYVELMDKDGYLRIPFAGRWRFSMRAALSGATGLEIRLATGQASGGSGLLYWESISGGSSAVNGDVELICGRNDLIQMEIRHQTGSTLSMTAADALNKCQMIVTYMGGA